MKKSKINTNEKTPGYPQYGKDADIYENAQVVNADPENLNKEIERNPEHNKKEIGDDNIMESPVPEGLISAEEEISRNEHDLTPDDINALGDMDDDNDGGEDEILKQDRVYPIDMAGDDLDFPGDDDADEFSNEDDDEENKLYSESDN